MILRLAGVEDGRNGKCVRHIAIPAVFLYNEALWNSHKSKLTRCPSMKLGL